MELHVWTLLWTLLNLSLILLGITFLVFGILAFRKYIKSEARPGKPQATDARDDHS